MSKKKKVILIGVAVTLALVMGVGGVAQAFLGIGHPVVPGHRLVGVGWCDSYWSEPPDMMDRHERHLDTLFIVTNPNCDKWLTIDRMFILNEAEELVYDSEWVEVPPIPNALSPHEIWEFYLSEYVHPEPVEGWWQPPQHMDKYTVEIIWDGEAYGWWWRARVCPLQGWMKQFLKTEHYHLEPDVCWCEPDPDNPCRWVETICEGDCKCVSEVPGVKCIDGTCECIDWASCKCMHFDGVSYVFTCPGWVPYWSDIEMSESQMVNCQSIRIGGPVDY